MNRAWMLVAILLLATPASAAPTAFGLGDVVFKKELKEALPNAFGGKDIWGRKRTIGLLELRYLGLEGQTAVFGRRDTRILTNETTLNRSRAVVGNVGGSSVFIAGVGTGPTIQPLAPSEIAIPVDLQGDRSMVIDGVTLEVVSATTNRVVLEVPATAAK